MRTHFGLVMTGGGARGAYQAGVLLRISELFKNRPSPFKTISGASAGAINGTLLASMNENYQDGAQKLTKLWSDLTAESVYETSTGSLSWGAMKLMKDLSLGGALPSGGGNALSLLRTDPLAQFLGANINYEGIEENIRSGHLSSLSIVATDYTSGKSFIFIHGKPGHATWKRSRRVTIPTRITSTHVLASAAIPILFPPVLISTEFGDSHFGDGCLRLVAPLSPAIRLGAEKILAIGVRSQRGPEDGFERYGMPECANHAPPLARVIGVIMNAIFLDHLDSDVEHLWRMNEIIRGFGASQTTATRTHPMRLVDCLSISPSVDLGNLAMEYSKSMPKIIRYFLRGLGSNPVETSELMSYLLFDKAFTGKLAEIGYEDAQKRISEIEAFFTENP